MVYTERNLEEFRLLPSGTNTINGRQIVQIVKKPPSATVTSASSIGEIETELENELMVSDTSIFDQICAMPVLLQTEIEETKIVDVEPKTKLVETIEVDTPIFEEGFSMQTEVPIEQTKPIVEVEPEKKRLSRSTHLFSKHARCLSRCKPKRQMRKQKLLQSRPCREKNEPKSKHCL